jgi:large subunit ribosomal protein L22
MAYTNVHRMARISPKKARLVMNMIRGKSLGEALDILDTNKRRASVLIKQSLLAAQANADQAEADVRRLKVVQARVDAGPTIKRFRPKDRGRAHPILKRTSHLMVGVE